MARLSDEEFEALVEEALEELPPRFLEALDNVAVAIADEPTPDELEDIDYGTSSEAGELLGLYDGVALTERDGSYGEFGCDVPDLVTIFKGPHERSFDTREELLEQVKVTVCHELGHYFGLDDDDLDRLGIG
jgi:predicted Zn-dependent protease with MMP-like domain